MTGNRLYVTGLLFLIIFSGCTTKNRQSTRIVSDAQKIIFETDIGNDVDDALACENDAVNYAKCVSLMKKGNEEPLFRRSLKDYHSATCKFQINTQL